MHSQPEANKIKEQGNGMVCSFRRNSIVLYNTYTELRCRYRLASDKSDAMLVGTEQKLEYRTDIACLVSICSQILLV